ncbi:cyclopropane-fatty-acyl-phospholipid synthase family protein [soil metagenome]
MTSIAPFEPKHAGSPPPLEPIDDGTTVAAVLTPLLHTLLGSAIPVRFVFWDRSAVGPVDSAGVIRVSSPNAIRRIMWAPGQLGIARAYVAGDLEIHGDIFDAIVALRDATPTDLKFGPGLGRTALAAAHRLGVLGLPPPPPAEESSDHGRRHSIGRDARAIGHHYDVGNDFYRLVLGPSMTYSCARFTDRVSDLAGAQQAKHELICRKLGLHRGPGRRLLDVGCGWGSLALHAAGRHGARVVGITISDAQAQLARGRVAAAGLSGQIEIRLQDYRELADETFDAVASVGMSEHVGEARLRTYFDTLHGVLTPGGRLLNHAISSTGGSRLARRSFAGRYVFPDGELVDVGTLQITMQRSGFEIRDVESLREHYALTLRHWVANLEVDWGHAVSLVGLGRARVWHLYMAASAIGFEDAGLSIHQVLGVKTAAAGDSDMPHTRAGWN